MLATGCWGACCIQLSLTTSWSALQKRTEMQLSYYTIKVVGRKEGWRSKNMV